MVSPDGELDVARFVRTAGAKEPAPGSGVVRG
jgi:hypothetical protein